MSKKKTTQEFIQDAYCIHGDKYNYKLVDYKNNKTKIKIICPEHGVFEQMPGSHLSGIRCPVCYGGVRLSTEQFIQKAYCKHGDRYNYKLVEYKNAHTKVKIICPKHGIFEQIPNNHISKSHNCPKCRFDPSTEGFIQKAYCIHGDKYNYKLSEYKHSHIKIKIICHKHGIFEQISGRHIKGYGCPKCAGVYGKRYSKDNIPLYDTYHQQLEPYDIKHRRSPDDENILEVRCMYCGRWNQPTRLAVVYKIQCINGKRVGESNLYCSDNCKKACPTYGHSKYPKGFKQATSREVQPHLRKLVLKRDNYQCIKCGATDKQLHCHHLTGVELNPIESADVDNCITLCYDCHKQVHKEKGCGYNDLRRKKCQ